MVNLLTLGYIKFHASFSSGVEGFDISSFIHADIFTMRYYFLTFDYIHDKLPLHSAGVPELGRAPPDIQASQRHAVAIYAAYAFRNSSFKGEVRLVLPMARHRVTRCVFTAICQSGRRFMLNARHITIFSSIFRPSKPTPASPVLPQRFIVFAISSAGLRF